MAHDDDPVALGLRKPRGVEPALDARLRRIAAEQAAPHVDTGHAYRQVRGKSALWVVVDIITMY